MIVAFRFIILSNGLRALLISDFSRANQEGEEIPEELQETEEEDEEEKDCDSDEGSDEEEEQEEEQDSDFHEPDVEKKKKKKGGVSSEKQVGGVTWPITLSAGSG